MECEPRILGRFESVTGWRDHGRIERMRILPEGLRGRLRAVLESTPFATLPRPDAIWLSAWDVDLHLWAQLGPWRRPVLLELDSTPKQLDAMAPWYFGRPPRRGVRARIASARTHLLYRNVTRFNAWSQWAAQGLKESGVAADRITVIPPGVDLRRWEFRERVTERRAMAQPFRMLFVGGDFVRKGGDMLVEFMRSPAGEAFELDIVTRDTVDAAPRTRLHRLEANSPELRSLYANADLFVMPTRADCFGIAAIEAMASGLPVLMGDVGAAREIVDPGATGWLIEPETREVAAALSAVAADPGRLPAMGARARAVAEQRFDGARNDRLVIDVLLEMAGRHEAGRAEAASGREGSSEGSGR